MKFTAATFLALTALAASEIIVLDTRTLDARGLDDLFSSLTSKASSKYESVTDNIADGVSSVKTAWNEASASASNKANPSGFTFPAVATATADANKLLSYINSVDKFIPTKVVEEWKDGATPTAVEKFVKELPEKYTAAAKDGWSSLSKEVAKATSTPESKAANVKDEKKDDDDDDEDDDKDDEKDEDGDKEDKDSGAMRSVGVASMAMLAGVAGMAVIVL